MSEKVKTCIQAKAIENVLLDEIVLTNVWQHFKVWYFHYESPMIVPVMFSNKDALIFVMFSNKDALIYQLELKSWQNSTSSEHITHEMCSFMSPAKLLIFPFFSKLYIGVASLSSEK